MPHCFIIGQVGAESADTLSFDMKAPRSLLISGETPPQAYLRRDIEAAAAASAR